MVRQADEKMIRVKSITAVSIIAWLIAVIVCFTLFVCKQKEFGCTSHCHILFMIE